ncbi:ABC transporter permease [Candidatus Bipolaricaulota bacterium]|nr:ABC transporter permease [Candidatus Bipolaricaulota bacterium]TFH08914.1 MAG: ABC transporter permease [Candidatus Atribacteria bacterium]
MKKKRKDTSPKPIETGEVSVRHGESYWRYAWRRFRRHRLAMVAGVVLVILILGAIFAPWLSPYNYSRQNRSNMFDAPSFRVEEDQVEDKCVRPRVLWWRCGVHPFGTDDLGRDILTRVLQGGRVSLIVGFSAAFISTLLGTMIGAIAGYWGGIIDSLTSRLIEIMLSIPQLPLLLILVGLLANPEVQFGVFLTGLLGDSKSIVMIIGVIILLSWMGTARLVRGQVIALKQRDFVEAARAVGASRIRIAFRHLLPNVTSVIIVQGTLMTGEAILIESGLSFLGLGIQPPAVSWGNMLSRAQGFLYYPNGIYIAFFPGLCILLTVLCANFVGDGLRDALDPRYHGRV